MRKRAIKFRIPLFERDGVFNSFSYWGAINSISGAPIKTHDSFVSPSQNSVLLKGWHEQYIGFDDVDGAEIYEGDIVKDIKTGDIGIVKFSHPYAHGFYVRVFTSGDPLEVDPMWYSVSDEGIKTLRVIGNIHANKDMRLNLMLDGKEFLNVLHTLPRNTPDYVTDVLNAEKPLLDSTMVYLACGGLYHLIEEVAEVGDRVVLYSNILFPPKNNGTAVRVDNLPLN